MGFVQLCSQTPANNIDEFELKQVDKDKLYSFLREMEFNRLLSSAISTYGESKFSGGEIKTAKSNEESNISKESY